jgi:hypothetical protein
MPRKAITLQLLSAQDSRMLLASLHRMRDHLQAGGTVSAEIHDIATGGGRFPMMDHHQVDALIERVGLAGAPLAQAVQALEICDRALSAAPMFGVPSLPYELRDSYKVLTWLGKVIRSLKAEASSPAKVTP